MNYSRAFKGSHSLVSDKWTTYLELYDEIINSRFSRKSILEIGIQNGGSLEVWRKVFPRAKLIVGVDKNENVKKIKFKSKRIQVVVGDICSPQVISEIMNFGPFDYIIDNGSHQSKDVISTLISLWSLLKSGGKYIIEDFHCSYWPEFQNYQWASITSISF